MVGLDDGGALVALSKGAVGVDILNQVQNRGPHAKADAEDCEPDEEEDAQGELCGPATRQAACQP